MAEASKFGMYHMYTSYPTRDPDNEQDLENLCHPPGLWLTVGRRTSAYVAELPASNRTPTQRRNQKLKPAEV